MADEIHMPQSNAPTVVTVYVDAPPGEDGDDGRSATLRIGTVATLPAGSAATVANVGTALDAVFDFGIPRGADGGGGGGSPAILVESGPESKITDMPVAVGIDGTEIICIVKAFINQQSDIAQISAFVLTQVPAALLMESGSASKISDLPAAAAIDGTELVCLVQAGADVQTTVTDIAAFIGGAYLPLAGGTMSGTIATTGISVAVMTGPDGNPMITAAGDFCYPFNNGQLTTSQALNYPGPGDGSSGPYCLAVQSGQPVILYPNSHSLLSQNLDICFSDGNKCFDGTTFDIVDHAGHLLVDGSGNRYYGDGSNIAFPAGDNKLLYASGTTFLDSSQNVLYPSGAPMIDASGPNVLDPVGNKLWDSSGNRYYGNNSTIMIPATSTILNDSSGSGGSSGDVPVNNGSGFTWGSAPAGNPNPLPTQTWIGTPLTALSQPVVFVDTSGGPITVTLPSSPTDGETYTIIKSGSGALTVTPSGSGTALKIDGVAANFVPANSGSQIVLSWIYDSNNGIGWTTCVQRYGPGAPGNWNGTAPNTSYEALDRLAAWIAANSTALALVGVVGKP